MNTAKTQKLVPHDPASWVNTVLACLENRFAPVEKSTKEWEEVVTALRWITEGLEDAGMIYQQDGSERQVVIPALSSKERYLS